MRLLSICFLTCLTLPLMANADKAKQTLQANYMVNYEILPAEVDSLRDIFTEGMIYGRLRSNWFFYQYENENIAKGQENQNILGLGGNLIYKTAPYAGFSATAGLYYTSAGTGLDNQPSDVGNLKAGRDVIERYNAVNGKGKSYAVLAQSYLQYESDGLKLRYGREVFNSFYTKSNDSKMIPNTFEGFTLESKEFKKTRIRAAYLTRQKLRNHDNFHSVIMYDDRTSEQAGVNEPSWYENDDSAIHQGLNYTNFLKHGQDMNPALMVLDGYTRSILETDMKVSASSMYIKDLFYSAMLELNYSFDLGNGYRLTPGVRYVQQFDDGAGKIGGAALTGKAATDEDGGNALARAAYSDPDSVDTYMTAARLTLKKNAAEIGLGYTNIADKADFITPWRGFVTSGYTREMARYNWVANTETWRLRGSFDFGKANIISGLRTYMSFTQENYDEEKKPNADANIYYFGLIKDVEKVPNMSFRLRTEYVEQTAANTNDHTELRMELNYLF